ncbi:MAG: hypothetical protein KJO77_01320 [Bacteroidia bacterium]|nr:hypothetical protein [Bacteroidia bacterium]
MMLETTYRNKDHEKLIDEYVGKSFTLIQIIKMKGIGSKRMIIESVSPNFQQYLNTGTGLTYANIEMRPNGILVRLNKGLQNFTWIIPYYHLVIYKTNGASIHAQGSFINFRNNITLKENKGFFKKLLDQKVKHDFQYDFY